MGSGLSRKMDKKNSAKQVWKCGCTPCKCSPCECAKDDRIAQEVSTECVCSKSCDCSVCNSTVTTETERSSSNDSVNAGYPDVIVWGNRSKQLEELADQVKENCGKCTCIDCKCVECGSSTGTNGTCGASKASDVSELAAKFNPDIQETHQKCLTQNGCPCDPCSCYPFKCQPRQLKDKAQEAPKQLETAPIEQIVEQLDALTVDPSVESDAIVVTEVRDTEAIDGIVLQQINDEPNNGEIVALN